MELDTLMIILIALSIIFLIALPMLKQKAKKTKTVLDDKILTYLGVIIKAYLKKVFKK